MYESMKKLTPIYEYPKRVQFPFASVLSLELLIQFWEQLSRERECAGAGIAERLLAEVARVPEWRESITDTSILDKEPALLDALMTAVFPPASWESDLTGAFVPFSFDAFYTTPMFKKKFLHGDGDFVNHITMESVLFDIGKLIHAYLVILKRFYDIEVSFEYPLIASSYDTTLEIERYYRLRLDPRFVEVVAKEPVQPLSEKDRARVLAHLNDVELLKEIIPTDNFEFRGFIIINAVDVTDQELLSAVKNDLIERESLMTADRFGVLEKKIQSLLRQKEVRLGIAALPPENLRLGHGRSIGSSFVLNKACQLACETAEGSVYHRAFETGQPTIVDDIALLANPSGVERGLLSMGIRNIAVAPLELQGETVGVLELASAKPGTITPLSVMKLRELLPLFAMAIKRSNEELNNSVQAIIKEKCTAIHPAVEWRFRDAALKVIDKLNSDERSEMEDIVFEDVYPLYGLSDVRGSSTQRNIAIGADLNEQLSLAHNVITAAHAQRPLPFLSELDYRIGKMMAMINAGVSSGDEVTVLDFLRKDVESLFPHLHELGDATIKSIEAYKNAIDPDFGFLHHTRKEYEESVMMINDAISSYIDEQQVHAQEMFPHYFEKYKTDGVDHGMYIGASLVERREFNKMYLKNLRLWQLMLMCGVVRKSHAVKDRIRIPLDTAHLLLVQDQPLAIRFRYDEKKFDVDGTYNVRYEIMKKRIDKATLKGSEERLTQPGKIAIVYSHRREAEEYKRYIDYLQSTGTLLKEVEALDLEEMQGVQGLRALRVAVNTSQQTSDTIEISEVSAATKSFEHLAH